MISNQQQHQQQTKGRRTTTIKRIILFPLALAALALAAPAAGAQAAPKAYQVTGPVLEVSDTTIMVQKGKEKWLLERDASTKAKGDVKVGDKVTIEYRMIATTIENKSAPAAAGTTAAPPAPTPGGTPGAAGAAAGSAPATKAAKPAK